MSQVSLKTLLEDDVVRAHALHDLCQVTAMLEGQGINIATLGLSAGQNISFLRLYRLRIVAKVMIRILGHTRGFR